MADLGTGTRYLVEANRDVKSKWLDVQIQEKKSQIVRIKQDIEDLVKGRIIQLEAALLMLDREILKLESDKKLLDNSIDTEEV